MPAANELTKCNPFPSLRRPLASKECLV
jgi:hypothetical protein